MDWLARRMNLLPRKKGRAITDTGILELLKAEKDAIKENPEIKEGPNRM